MARRWMEPKWLCAGGAAAAVVLGAVLHWYALASSRATLARLEADVRAASDANATAQQSVRELPRLKESVRRFAKQVQPDPDLSDLISSVGVDVAGPGQAPQREIVSKPTINGHPVARVPFSLQYRGSFTGTVALLERLDQGELFARVERVVIDNESAADGERSLRVQVDFSTFARTSKELERWAQAE